MILPNVVEHLLLLAVYLAAFLALEHGPVTRVDEHMLLEFWLSVEEAATEGARVVLQDDALFLAKNENIAFLMVNFSSPRYKNNHGRWIYI